MRLAVYVGLPSLPAGALLNVFTAPNRLGDRLAGFGFLTVAYVVVLALSHWPRARYHPRTLAVAFMLTLGAGLLYLLSLSPADLDVLTGPVTCVIVGSTLLFPWGAAPQIIVSIALALGFGAILPLDAGLSGMRAANVLVSLGVSAGLAVLGAVILERSRRTAFDERQRVRALAVQRRHLIEIGRDLRSTLNAEAIAGRLALHAERLIPADAILLLLHEPETGGYRAVAASDGGPLPGLVDVSWDGNVMARFTALFAPAEVREVPGSPLDVILLPRLSSLGVCQMLLAAIGPHPTPVGFLVWSRSHAEPFTRGQRLAAQGMADQAFTALAAARLYEDAAKTARLKSEFVSTMSHELRTPLNVIMGYNQILNERLPPDPETTRALDGVRRASNELLDLVEATLDLGRLESGRESVREEPIAVRELFDELAGELAPVPRATGVALMWDVDEVTLRTDRRKLKIVLKNLAGNALKFTPAGSVRVECRKVEDRARFRVIDTGIGIRREDQLAVFEMFRQADSSDSRRYGGTGLGLYIVRQLVRLLEGEVTLESAPGQGSTFTVMIPLARAAGRRQRTAA